ncbi:glutamate-cysteine ligase catalytic subunit [Rhizoctonia solani]|uniref:Glutamate-cysteine ligase catalytic subunit n=1 Tax=Rhizoctonia solani TaxID=456999 RepID=A0A8H8P1U3_9AGAM|nr:glutamate-cysteine ligase catalytic subunit [Rhizoctonia solani]QRW23974.1 glutamate-cysteine ligase catalytic subunit [Rhizoctonia solani]
MAAAPIARTKLSVSARMTCKAGRTTASSSRIESRGLETGSQSYCAIDLKVAYVELAETNVFIDSFNTRNQLNKPHRIAAFAVRLAEGVWGFCCGPEVARLADGGAVNYTIRIVSYPHSRKTSPSGASKIDEGQLVSLTIAHGGVEGSKTITVNGSGHFIASNRVGLVLNIMLILKREGHI